MALIVMDAFKYRKKKGKPVLVEYVSDSKNKVYNIKYAMKTFVFYESLFRKFCFFLIGVLKTLLNSTSCNHIYPD